MGWMAAAAADDDDDDYDAVGEGYCGTGDGMADLKNMKEVAGVCLHVPGVG